MTTMPIVDMVAVALAGGGLDFHIGNLSAGDLTKVAAAAAKSKKWSTVMLRSARRLPQGDMVDIARAGEGRVVFVLD